MGCSWGCSQMMGNDLGKDLKSRDTSYSVREVHSYTLHVPPLCYSVREVPANRP